MRNPLLLLICLAAVASTPLALAADPQAAHPSTQVLLDQAKAHISAGRYNAALDSFDAALAQDPNNHLTLFRRGTVQLSLGRMAEATRDFDRVLAIKPGHSRALLQRAKLSAKQGRVQQAISDLAKLLEAEPANTEATELLVTYREAAAQLAEGERLAGAGHHEEAIAHLSAALVEMPYSIPVRHLRAQSHLATGAKVMAIADLSRVAQIESNSIPTLMQLAQLHLDIGELSGALTNAKDCLRLDQDQKECKKTFRTVKQLEKAIKAAEDVLAKQLWKVAINKLEAAKPPLVAQVEAFGPEAKELRKRVYSIICKAHGEMKDNKNTLLWCGKILEIDGENVDALVYRGEAKMDMELYEDAMRDFAAASQHGGQSQRIQQLHSKAQRLHQQASRKDYYKILGVPRTATHRDIRRAYQKLTRTLHPDKYQGDLSKEAVEKKMGEINEAYATLKDPELRARVDNGEDPNDANAGQGGHPFGGGHPFFQGGGGGFPFQFQQGGAGGGGSPFKFNFQFQ
ncbi:DnaJ sub C member 3 [Geranomyces variabilis]|nr:DnaJ sub C member 3 [Geranomyces variabilis]